MASLSIFPKGRKSLGVGVSCEHIIGATNFADPWMILSRAITWYTNLAPNHNLWLSKSVPQRKKQVRNIGMGLSCRSSKFPLCCNISNISRFVVEVLGQPQTNTSFTHDPASWNKTERSMSNIKTIEDYAIGNRLAWTDLGMGFFKTVLVKAVSVYPSWIVMAAQKVYKCYLSLIQILFCSVCLFRISTLQSLRAADRFWALAALRTL